MTRRRVSAVVEAIRTHFIASVHVSISARILLEAFFWNAGVCELVLIIAGPKKEEAVRTPTGNAAHRCAVEDRWMQINCLGCIPRLCLTSFRNTQGAYVVIRSAELFVEDERVTREPLPLLSVLLRLHTHAAIERTLNVSVVFAVSAPSINLVKENDVLFLRAVDSDCVYRVRLQRTTIPVLSDRAREESILAVGRLCTAVLALPTTVVGCLNLDTTFVEEEESVTNGPLSFHCVFLRIKASCTIGRSIGGVPGQGIGPENNVIYFSTFEKNGVE